MLFEDQRQLESLWTIEEWANETTDGSLADLPGLPDPGVWDRVCAEQGNCLGKKCKFYKNCFWQAAKRRMQGGDDPGRQPRPVLLRPGLADGRRELPAEV